MADKMSMSLDEIIKMNKSKGAGKGGRTFPAKGKATRAVAGKNRLRGNKPAATKRTVVQRNRGAASGGSIPLNQVKKIVNKAVKLAVRQSNPRVGIAGRLGGKIPRNIITNSSRLAAVSQRSRVIQRNLATPNIRRNRVFTNQRAPVQVIERIIEAPPVRVIRQPVQAPQVVQVVERVVPARQQRMRKFGARNVIVQERPAIARVAGGRVIRQQATQRIIPQQQRRQAPVVQRVIQQQHPQVVYRRAPQQQQRVQVVRAAPARQQFQVVRQNVPRGNRRNVQYVEYVEAGPSAASRKNNAMREALGLGNNRRGNNARSFVDDRFEPSTSFLSKRTVVQRGRGFNY